MEIFLSIIVPVYNVEAYLKYCLDSILKSTLPAHEILLVTGESTDSSNIICRKYEKQFSNVRVICQDQRGLSNARNCGLCRSKGKYIVFIDSDDFLDSESFEKTVDYLYQNQTENLEVLISDFKLVNKNGDLVGERRQIDDILESIPSPLNLEKFLNKKKNYWNVWRYIYKKTFLMKHGLLFKENYLSEDIEFSTRVIVDMEKYAFYHNPYYCYRMRREGSLVNCVTQKNAEDLMTVLESSIKYIEIEDDKVRKHLKKKLLDEYLLSYLMMLDAPLNSKREIKSIINHKIHLIERDKRYVWLVPVLKIREGEFWARLLRLCRCIKRNCKCLR